MHSMRASLMSTSSGGTPAISKQSLIDAANRLLTGLGRLGLTGKTEAHDAFEHWLWARTIAHARSTPGLAVQLRRAPAGRVGLRTSPSSVASGSFSYAEITGAAGVTELHTGIYVTGTSGAPHELDVAAIEQPVPGAATVPSSTLRWGLEAKLHARTLPLSIPRAVLGSAYDLGTLPAYRRGNPARFGLVTSAPLSATGRLLLTRSPSSWQHRRVPVAESVGVGRSPRLDVVIADFVGLL
jgi:hypothetical protein